MGNELMYTFDRERFAFEAHRDINKPSLEGIKINILKERNKNMESVKIKSLEGNNTREILEEIEILSTEFTECDKHMKCIQHVIKPIMISGSYFNRIFIGKENGSNEYQIDMLYKVKGEILDELSLDSITQGVEFRICKQMLQ